MNYKIINFSKITRLLRLMNNRIFCLLLAILYLVITVYTRYWLDPNLEELESQKAAIISRKFEENEKLGVKDIINILVTFALVNNEGLWIHSVKIEQNNIDLKIRSFDAKTIEKYIYEVAKQANLKVVNITTKNVKYKASAEEQGESEKTPLPFAAKVYLDSIKEDPQGDENDDSNNDKNPADEVFFAYEAEVKLLANSN